MKQKIRELEGSLTAWKRTAEARQGIEERYKLLAEKMTDTVWILDRDLRTAYVSPSIQKTLGFTPDEWIVRDIAEKLTPASRSIVFNALARELEMGPQGSGDPKRTANLELETFHKDGSIRWLEVIAEGIHDDRGSLTGIQGVSRDITKRRQAEVALQQTRDNFRRSLDESPLGVRIVSAEGETIYANRALLDLYAYESIDEFRTMPANARYTAASFAEYEQRKEQRKQGEDGPEEYEIAIVRKDGEVRHLQVFRKKILWDGKWQYQAIYQDVTERKWAEEALRKSEEYFRELVENISDIIFTVDERGIITYASPSVERITGYRPGELMGTSVFDLFVPEDLPRALSDFARSLLTKDAAIPNSFRIRHKNGAVLVMEGVGKNLLHNPAIASFVTNVRDITEKKRKEEERSALEEKLRLAQKMEAIAALAGGVAHDFNNLLTGIQGHVSMSLLHSDPSHPNIERLKRIREIVDSGAKLTGQLLGFAREEKREVLPTNMNNILDQTLLMFGRTKKEVSIHRKYAADLWAVEVDRGQMEQVFMNLYINAWQAMPVAGEIILKTKNVRCEGKQGMSCIVKPGRFVKVSITDNGVGMDRNTRERIFDPFFTTKDKEGGTGLGLTTVYGIIKGHNGVIDVVSEPGCGTSFHIYLPATERKIDKIETHAAEVLSGTETILLVDDEKTNLEVTGEILESIGYRVYKAGSGQEALAVYMEKRDRINLVILDMIMPGISGGETFDRLREINSELPVLLASGYNINSQVQQILDRGCNDFLQKPFHTETLSRKIREILS